MWRRVTATLESARPADADFTAMRLELLQTCITVEQRIEELIGTVDLLHSAYYNDADIIRSISEFIAWGGGSGSRKNVVRCATLRARGATDFACATNSSMLRISPYSRRSVPG